MKNLFKEIEKERENDRTIMDKDGNFHTPQALVDKMRKDFSKAIVNNEIPARLSLDEYTRERIESEYIHIDDVITPIKSTLKKKIHKADFTAKEETDTPAVN